jgi:hypothetical protein
MRKNFKRWATRRDMRPLTDEERETALLAEFKRHDSVASLAGAIAKRLGGKDRDADLIAGAGLGPTRGD